MSFFDDAAQELARANTIHPPFRSLHEGYAVLLEEVDELWDEIRRRGHRRPRVRAECVQIAAMAGKVVAFLDVGTHPKASVSPGDIFPRDLREKMTAELELHIHGTAPEPVAEPEGEGLGNLNAARREIHRLRVIDGVNKQDNRHMVREWDQAQDEIVSLRARIAELEAREVTVDDIDWPEQHCMYGRVIYAAPPERRQIVRSVNAALRSPATEEAP